MLVGVGPLPSSLTANAVLPPSAKKGRGWWSGVSSQTSMTTGGGAWYAIGAGQSLCSGSTMREECHGELVEQPGPCPACGTAPETLSQVTGGGVSELGFSVEHLRALADALHAACDLMAGSQLPRAPAASELLPAARPSMPRRAEASQSPAAHRAPAQFVAVEPLLAGEGSGDARMPGLGLGRGAIDQSSRRLDDIERNTELWRSLVTSGMPAASPSTLIHRSISGETAMSDLRECLLEELYDITPQRVLEVYNNVLRNDGAFSAASLGKALELCGMTGLPESVADRIMREIAPNCGGRLWPAEFESILSRLKMAQLLFGRSALPEDDTLDADEPGFGVPQLFLVDYDAQGHRVDTKSGGSLHEFFFGHRPVPRWLSRRGVRWVHLDRLNLKMLLSLTVKYSLHPLAVEDTLQQVNTKVDRHGGHYFAAIQQLSLMGEPDGRRPVRVNGYHVSAFCSGPPNSDTLVTVAQLDSSFSTDWPGFQDDIEADDDSNDDASPQCGQLSDWVVRLKRRITAPLSRLRERQANFLLLQVFDVCSDDLVTVTHAYTLRLSRLETQLREQGTSLPNSWLDELSKIRLQLAVVLRQARGMLRALKHYGEYDANAELSGYIRDIADHLDEVADDSNILSEKCAILVESHERALERSLDEARQLAGDSLNRTLFVLTVITTILMPLQLLAGVYGMNFVREDGMPSIPELVMPQGYNYFWMFSGVYLLVSCCLASCLYCRNRSAVQGQRAVRAQSQHAAAASGLRRPRSAPGRYALPLLVPPSRQPAQGTPSSKQTSRTWTPVVAPGDA